MYELDIKTELRTMQQSSEAKRVRVQKIMYFTGKYYVSRYAVVRCMCTDKKIANDFTHNVRFVPCGTFNNSCPVCDRYYWYYENEIINCISEEEADIASIAELYKFSTNDAYVFLR